MGKVARYIGWTLGIGSLVAIASYIGTCNGSNFIAERQNRFNGTTEVRGRIVDYSGMRPYKTRFKEAKGRLEIKYRNDDTIKIMDNDLTMPGLSLDDRVTLLLPNGAKIEFNNSGFYDDKGKHQKFGDNTEAERVLQDVFSDAEAVHSEVEKALKETVLRK